MSEQELHDLLCGHFNGDTIEVGGDGRHFEVRIVSDKFADLSLLKRQQMVFSLVSGQILSGNLHALNIQALTSDELECRNG